jgi:hypothetical protein
MEDVDIFHVHRVYFTARWYILWPFRLIYGHLVYIFPFWYVVPKKSGNSDLADGTYSMHKFI